MLTMRGEHPDEVRREAQDWYHAKGEKVRVSPTVRFAHETPEEATGRRAAFGRTSLTVRETIVDEEGHVLYAFDEIAGEHNARAFEDARGTAHDYGVALVVDGDPWLVPLDPKAASDEPTVAGTPKRLDLGLDRFGRLNFPPEPGALLAHMTAEPMEGEFDMVTLEDGTFLLQASAWHVTAEPSTVASLTQAVLAHRDAVAFQP